MDRDARDETLSHQGRKLRNAVEKLPGVTCDPVSGDRVTGLRVIVDNAPKLAEALREGSPSIWCNVDDESLSFGLHTVEEGDEMVIADRLKELLS